MSMHQVGRKLGIKSAHRKAMFGNMVVSLIKHERIETTLTRAKEIRRIAEKMVTLGKRGTLAARRKALTVVKDKDAIKKVFSEMTERFADRKGGYTRIYRLGFRHGDNAPMALIEYLPPAGGLKKKEVSEVKKSKKSAKPKQEDETKIEKPVKEEKKETKAKKAKSPTKEAKTKKEKAEKEPKKEKKGLFGRKKK